MHGCFFGQEAEIEEDSEAARAVDWDKTAADAAYRAQVP